MLTAYTYLYNVNKYFNSDKILEPTNTKILQFNLNTQNTFNIAEIRITFYHKNRTVNEQI